MTNAHRNEYRARNSRITLGNSAAPSIHGPLVFIICAFIAVVFQPISASGSEIEPVLSETDAVAGIPLVMPVRLIGSGAPPAQVTLRFPDGREVIGDVAAVRLSTQTQTVRGWIDSGPIWDVLSIAEGMRATDGVAWFVLADLPPGVIGQEIWLGGRPVNIRWLSRPAVLAMRLGFSMTGDGINPLNDPWMSPVPSVWRSRSDFTTALDPAHHDPLRSWRALLATEGLYPETDREVVGVTPEFLKTGVVEAVAQDRPIRERLLEAITSLTTARWRMALAQLWAADSALSLRVRHALAGAGEFVLGSADSDRVIAPVWTAGPFEAAALLDILLDREISLTDRAASAQDWLAGLPEFTVWVMDDGAQSESLPLAPTLGAMRFAAGDVGAFLMHSGPEIARPRILPTRTMQTLRPLPTAGIGDSVVYRINGENHRFAINPSTIPLVPPGLATGSMAPDITMSGFVAATNTKPTTARKAARNSARMIATVDAGQQDEPPRCTLLMTIPANENMDDAWECRVWLGPYRRTRAVIITDHTGDSAIQPMAAAGGVKKMQLPRIERGIDDGDLRVEIALPIEATEPDGTIHIGVEIIHGDGSRVAWPRPMIPWQIEPGRKVLDPSAWLGDLGR